MPADGAAPPRVDPTLLDFATIPRPVFGKPRNTGLRISVRKDDDRAVVWLFLGDAARALLGAQEGDHWTIAVAVDGAGLPVLWLRRATPGDPDARSAHNGGQRHGRSLHLRLTARVGDITSFPATDADFSPHPKGGLLVRPRGDGLSAAVASVCRALLSPPPSL